MKNIFFTLIICFFNLMSCMAQKSGHLIKTADGYGGQEISYITSQTFEHLKIYKDITIRAIAKSETVKDVIDLLGQPNDVKIEKDIAIDGTVLFKRKLMIYPGLLLVFPEKDGKYKLSRIDYTSGSSTLKINGNKIRLGMTKQEVSNVLPGIEQLNSKRSVNIHVAENVSAFQTKNNGSSNFKFTDKYIKIKFNPVNQTVKEISILMYTI